MAMGGGEEVKSENMKREVKSGQVKKRREVKVIIEIKVIFFGPQRTPAGPSTAQGISDVRYKRHSLETLENRGHSRDMQLNGDCGLDWLDGAGGGRKG